MEKKWYQSRTLWIAIVAGVIGILGALGIAIPDYVIAVLTALGLYTARTSTEGIK